MTNLATKIIILASSSPRRQELTRSLGLPYRIEPSDVDETTEPGLTPQQIVEQLAVRKAQAVYERFKVAGPGQEHGIIIGSDTIVVLDGEVLGKPTDAEEAIRVLSRLQGRHHLVYSGIACIDTETGEPMDKTASFGDPVRLGEVGEYRVAAESSNGQPHAAVGYTVSKVTFRPMNNEEIQAYVKTGEPLDKAGSYGVQGIGAVFIEKIEGDFYSVMGFPLNLLYPMLLQFGVSPFQAK